MKEESTEVSNNLLSNTFFFDWAKYVFLTCSTIGTNGFSVSQRNALVTMVANNWSNNVMVTIHHSSLMCRISLKYFRQIFDSVLIFRCVAITIHHSNVQYISNILDKYLICRFVARLPLVSLTVKTHHHLLKLLHKSKMIENLFQPYVCLAFMTPRT